MIAKSSTFTTDTNADATLTPAKIQLISTTSAITCYLTTVLR